MVQIKEDNLSFSFLYVLKDSTTAGTAGAEVPVFTEVTKFTEVPVTTAHVEFTAESF